MMIVGGEKNKINKTKERKIMEINDLTIMEKVIQKCEEDGNKNPIMPQELLDNKEVGEDA